MPRSLYVLEQLVPRSECRFAKRTFNYCILSHIEAGFAFFPRRIRYHRFPFSITFYRCYRVLANLSSSFVASSGSCSKRSKIDIRITTMARIFVVNNSLVTRVCITIVTFAASVSCAPSESSKIYIRITMTTVAILLVRISIMILIILILAMAFACTTESPKIEITITVTITITVARLVFLHVYRFNWAFLTRTLMAYCGK
mmetsp:Transcript_15838/g.17881  ORF Transcript_15838/g.17881 Transcript_15838/m.17881 type:complete len:201 (+) Transcript_15838:351-953(+)